MNYIVHFCRNDNQVKHNGRTNPVTYLPDYCDNAWLDEDLRHWQKPQRWKYCPSCVAKGYQNPNTPPIDEAVRERMKKISKLAIETKAKNRQKHRTELREQTKLPC